MDGISNRKVSKITAEMALFEAVFLRIIARLSAKIVKFAFSISNLYRHERNY